MCRAVEGDPQNGVAGNMSETYILHNGQYKKKKYLTQEFKERPDLSFPLSPESSVCIRESCRVQSIFNYDGSKVCQNLTFFMYQLLGDFSF